MAAYDSDYYAKRADAEKLQAKRANGPEAAKAHAELAALYRDRSQQTERQNHA